MRRQKIIKLFAHRDKSHEGWNRGKTGRRGKGVKEKLLLVKVSGNTSPKRYFS